MRHRFLPQDAHVRATVLELEERRGRGDHPPVMVRVVCHDQSIGQVWDLGPGRSLFVAKNERMKPMIYDGDSPRRGKDRLALVEACFPEAVGDPVEDSRMMPRSCPSGHPVMLPRSVLRGAVERYRGTGRPVTIALRLDRSAGSPPFGVLRSVE